VTDAEMRARLGAARVARLATVSSDGRPHLVPICFVLDGDSIVSVVDDKPKTTRALRRLANVRANPRVSVLVDEYDDADWSRLWWVRADGIARVLESGAERALAVDALRGKYGQYRAEPPDGPVLAVHVETWRGWAASA
jgi:PPOX class probable F420-dependent enzyme